MILHTSDTFAALADLRRPVHLAIGMFDGVHLGHQSVIDSALRSARLDDGLSAVLTFRPHPSHLFQPDNPTPQIYPPPVKKKMLRKMNLDLYLEQNFDADFAARTAGEFVDYLRTTLPTLVSLSVGENFHFGRGRKGNVPTLIDLAGQNGISVYSCERVQLDGSPISSTRLRSLLPVEPIETVNHLLGHPYTYIGQAQPGRRLGRTIGFPTLNLPFTAEIPPMRGVYFVRFGSTDQRQAQNLRGVANLGFRPTVNADGDPTLLLEIHALDDCPFDQGDELVVEFLKFHRPEWKFSGVEELKQAITADVQTAELHLCGRK